MLAAMLTHRPRRKDGSHLDMQALATEVGSLAQDVNKDLPSAWDFIAIAIGLIRRVMAFRRLNLRAAFGSAAHALVYVLFYSCCCLITFWLLHAGSLYWRDNKYWKLPKGGLKPYFGCQHDLLGNSCPQQQLLYQDLLYLLLMPAVLATSAILLLTLSASRRDGPGRYSCFQRWMAVMLPPRRFWLRWCDGLTVQDGMIISIWFIVNLSWFSAVAGRNIHQKLSKLQPTKNITNNSPQNSSTALLFATAQLVRTALQRQQQADRLLVIKTVYKCVARSLGAVLFPNLTALFYPVSRGSVVLQAFYIPYPAAIRYHRWLGHVCLALTSTHALLYWAVWMFEGRWLTTAFKQDPDFNYLFGGIAFLCGLTLWITSLERVRRSNYQLFKVMHHIGFWGWLVCAICHNWYLFWFSLPGLVLYCIDAVYRLHQAAAATAAEPQSSNSRYLTSSSSSSSSGGVQVMRAMSAPDLSMCSLLISCTGYSSADTGFIWLSVPELQRWGTWHPFEYITVPIAAATTTGSSSSDGGPCCQPNYGLLIHIKAYNRWTRKLVRLVAVKGMAVGVKAQGPYAKRPCGPVAPCPKMVTTTASPGQESSVGVLLDRRQPSGLVMIAGGMGATAVLSVLTELQATAAAGGGGGVGLPVLLIWICRSVTEFEFMGPRVLNMAAAAAAAKGGGVGGLGLSVRLFLTGPLPSHLSWSSNPMWTNISPAATLQQPTHEQQSTSLTMPPFALADDAIVQVMGSTSSSGSSSHTPLLLQPQGMQQQQQIAASVMQSAVLTSPLCPVAAVGSLWAQAGHKLLMHAAVYASVFTAVLAARYLSLIRPAEPWPTARMGALYAALIAAAGITAGSTVLLLTHAFTPTKQQWQRQRQEGWCQKALAYAPVHYSKLRDSEQNDPVFTDLEDNKQLDCCSAVHVVAAVAQAGIMGRVTAAGSPPAAAATTGQGAPSAAVQLSIPAVAGVCEGSSWPVELGRPPLKQLVTAWLAGSTPQSPPAAAGGAVDAKHDWGATHDVRDGVGWPFISGVQQYNVYCMGPVPLIHSVMLMCDELNKQQYRTREGGLVNHCIGTGRRQPVVHLKCIRETWEL